MNFSLPLVAGLGIASLIGVYIMNKGEDDGKGYDEDNVAKKSEKRDRKKKVTSVVDPEPDTSDETFSFWGNSEEDQDNKPEKAAVSSRKSSSSNSKSSKQKKSNNGTRRR